MAKYTYFYVEPSTKPSLKKHTRFTRGEYAGITESSGPFGFRYAIFCNRASEIYVPLHDLTPETKATLGI